MFGHPAPMNEIVAICRPKGIRVIEDVAQAVDAELDGKLVGTFGDIACFSFYPGKNLGAYGDAGGLTTDDDVLAERLRRRQSRVRERTCGCPNCSRSAAAWPF